MVLIHSINDNILIPFLSYSGVYWDEAKKTRDLGIDKYVLGLEPNQKNDKTAVHVSPSTLGIKTSAQHAIEWMMGVVG